MKKGILILTTLLAATSSAILAKVGINIVNNSGKEILVKIDKMAAKDWIALADKKEQFVETTDRGERGIYWTTDKTTYYSTPKFSSPDKVEIKDGKNFKITETFKLAKAMEAKEETLAAVEKSKTETDEKKTDLKKIAEKTEQIIQLPENVLTAAKKVFSIIDTLEIVAEGLAQESQRIKDAAKTIETKKLIHEKIALLNEIVGKNARTFVQMGAYPLMNSISDLLSITGKNIVGVFDQATGKTIADISDTIKSLKTNSGGNFITATETKITKAKDAKSIAEYVELVEKILRQAEATFKNTIWFLNTAATKK